MNTPEYGDHPLLTLSVALLFAAIFLFGGRLAPRFDPMGLRRFLSFAAGISVAYTFVHVLPALARSRICRPNTRPASTGFSPNIAFTCGPWLAS